jgi:ABC-2 type transport system ATP-binding protein
VIEGFDLLRDIYRAPQDRYAATRDELVALLKLDKLLNQPVRQLSLGQRMRCEIAAALLHKPQLIFLDEPTIGLDAPSKLAVREFVGRLNRERGVTVILTTHDMHDIEALAERVIVIGGGRILADGSFATLRAGVLAERRLFVDFAEAAPEIDLPDVRVVARDGRQLELAFDPRRITAPDLIARIVAAHPVDDIHVEEPLIEEVIARFYDLHGAGEA